MSEARNEGKTIADKIENDRPEVGDADLYKCWLRFHNLAQERRFAYDVDFERTGLKHKEEWHYKLTTKEGSYEGYALRQMGAKNLAAKRALVAMGVEWRAV